MGVRQPKGRKDWVWEFWEDGVRYHGYEKTEAEATTAEADQRYDNRKAKEQQGPRAGQRTFLCPTISEWAGTYFTETKDEIERDKNKSAEQKATKLKDLENNLTVALRFWGAKPVPKPGDPEPRKNRNTGTKDLRPYHDLRLNDPIDDIAWLPKFQRHLNARGIAKQTMNNLRYAMSNLYDHALRLENREQTGIVVNPFKGLEKHTPRRRTKALSIEEFMAIYVAAAPHLQLALDIGVYAYALRHKEVLRLSTDHLDRDLTTITFREHKASGDDQLPKTVPISATLREILRTALADPTRNPRCKFIVQYPERGQKGVKGGIKTHVGRALARACERAGIQYGLAGQGVTFHTLRHTMGTEAAKEGIDREKRRQMMSQRTYVATDWYAHAQCETHRPDMDAFNASIAAARADVASKMDSPIKVPSKVPSTPVLRFAAGRGSRR